MDFTIQIKCELHKQAVPSTPGSTPNTNKSSQTVTDEERSRGKAKQKLQEDIITITKAGNSIRVDCGLLGIHRDQRSWCKGSFSFVFR